MIQPTDLIQLFETPQYNLIDYEALICILYAKKQNGKLKYPALVLLSEDEIDEFEDYLVTNWHTIPINTRFQILQNPHFRMNRQYWHWMCYDYLKIENRLCSRICLNFQKDEFISDTYTVTPTLSFQSIEMSYKTQHDLENCAVFSIDALLRLQHLNIHNADPATQNGFVAKLMCNVQDIHLLVQNRQSELAQVMVTKNRTLLDHYLRHVNWLGRNYAIQNKAQKLKKQTLPYLYTLRRNTSRYRQILQSRKFWIS